MTDETSTEAGAVGTKEIVKDALAVRMKAFFTMDNTRIYRDKRFAFLAAGGAAILIGAIALPKDTSQSPVIEVAEIIEPKIDLSRYDIALEEPKTETSLTTLKVRSGDSLGPLLQKNGVSGGQAYKITQAFATVYKPRNVRVGQEFNLHFNGETLEHLTFKPNVEKTIFVDLKDNDYTAREVAAEFKYETIGVAASIKNSLYVDATRLGAPDRVVQQFANIYEYSVDFQRDIQPGDNFELFFEVARNRKGEIIKSGDLLYTSFSPRGKQSEYWLYVDSKDRENFYDEKGKTAKRKLRATPVNGARLSSSFGKRRHPILGYRKMHSGVDFAAPRGTPILAAGSGTVERANRYGGYGNYIRIRHTDGYKTAYAHLSKFARGVRKGKYVKQDQVIGYVGTTGRSTGPHLHYEVHHHGKKINPRRLSQLAGKPLAKSEMPNFAKRRKEIEAMRLASETIRAAPVSVVMTDTATN
ncbi:M23 family metallopeptidase [Hellea balneolensis]|uniref:M23 family metallopeptidase n=1 Tax=Hellea balneolensis TaxID=287478 RepID=UPI00040979DB|nr:M23 family metallopeptidase [Hellea balneolensis]